MAEKNLCDNKKKLGRMHREWALSRKELSDANRLAEELQSELEEEIEQADWSNHGDRQRIRSLEEQLQEQYEIVRMLEERKEEIRKIIREQERVNRKLRDDLESTKRMNTCKEVLGAIVTGTVLIVRSSVSRKG